MPETTTEAVQLPERLVQLFEGKARYRVAFGGRGSGKTMGFAMMAVLKAFQLSQEGQTGVILCCRQFMSTLADSSFAEIKNAIKQMPWLSDYFEIGEKFIRSRDRNIEFLFYGLSRNLDSLKSIAHVHVCWVDEAASVTEEAWRKLIPSIRETDSEIWVTYNPEHKHQSTDIRFRQKTPKDAKITEINWRHNAFFPKVLDDVRLNDKEHRPEYYEHIWEGDYLTVVEGAYYTKQLTRAKEDGRITSVPHDPLMATYAFFDIGGTGAKSDNTAIWIAQFIGKEIRVIDYNESKGQTLGTHVAWLRKNGYGDALCVLPHDGRQHDKVFGVSYESSLDEAGFSVEVVPNQGKGAAIKRIDEARRLFDRCWFDERKTSGGIEALKFYHSNIDEARGIDLGPLHDWSSHAADSFGLMCIYYEEPQNYIKDFDTSEFNTAWVL